MRQDITSSQPAGREWPEDRSFYGGRSGASGMSRSPVRRRLDCGPDEDSCARRRTCGLAAGRSSEKTSLWCDGFGGDAVAVGEGAFEAAAYEGGGERAAGNGVADAVLDVTGRGTVGLDQVGVFPEAKGTAKLDVSEGVAFVIVAVFQYPAEPEGTDVDGEHHPGAVADAAVLQNLNALPRRGQAL